jgi:signal transduction histidine kinase
MAWFVRLRWLAVAGITLFPPFGRYVMRLRLTLWPFMATAAFVGAYNAALHVWGRSILKSDDDELRARRHWSVQVIADLFALTLVVYLGGGIANPFVLYYVFHVVIAAMLLPWRHVLAHSAVACLLLSGAALLEYWAVLPHAEAGGIFAADVRSDSKAIVIVLFAFTSTVFILAFFVSSVAERLREREAELVRANAELAESDRAKSLYVMRVAHDIRSPVASAVSCLAPLTHGMAGSVSEEALDMIRRAKRRAEFAGRLAQDLLNLSKIRAARDLARRPVQITTIIREVLAQEDSAARRKDVALRVAVSEDLPAFQADPEALHELVANLVSNAVKYTQPGGRVNVAALDGEGSARIEVSDNGVGIPAADLPHIFEEFYRAANVRQEGTESTGLGLAIAEEIVKAHRGTISVESTEGQGTTVVIVLPHRAEDEKQD